jgi:hypothetical protein
MGDLFARHGSYLRVTPPGLRVARRYCPEGHRTFSLLPDFLAAGLPGLLDTIQACVAVVQSARSMESAADLVRGGCDIAWGDPLAAPSAMCTTNTRWGLTSPPGLGTVAHHARPTATADASDNNTITLPDRSSGVGGKEPVDSSTAYTQTRQQAVKR